MLSFICLIVSVVVAFALVGCQNTDDQPVSSAPEASQATENVPPSDTNQLSEEQHIQEIVRAMLDTHLENLYLYTDHSFDAYTILALSEGQATRTVEADGQEILISDLFSNIEFLFDKEIYWKHVRQDITREDFATTYFFPEFSANGDAVSIDVDVNIGYRYIDSDTDSFEGLTFEVDLISIDGQWYICDVTEQFSAFDGQYKDDPNFDVDALIVEYDAAQAAQE